MVFAVVAFWASTLRSWWHALGGGLFLRAPCAVCSSSRWPLPGQTLGGGLPVRAPCAVCSCSRWPFHGHTLGGGLPVRAPCAVWQLSVAIPWSHARRRTSCTRSLCCLAALGGHFLVTRSAVDFLCALLVQFAAALGGELLGHALGGGLLLRAPCAVCSSSWWRTSWSLAWRWTSCACSLCSFQQLSVASSWSHARWWTSCTHSRCSLQHYGSTQSE